MMYVKQEEIRKFIKEEFETTSFTIDLGKQIPRGMLFDMFLRADEGFVWSTIIDCLALEHKEFDF